VTTVQEMYFLFIFKNKRFNGGFTGLLKLLSVELVNVAGTCNAEDSVSLVALLLLANCASLFIYLAPLLFLLHFLSNINTRCIVSKK